MKYLTQEYARYRNRTASQRFGDVLPLKLQTYATFVQDLVSRTDSTARARVVEVGSGSGICLALLSQEGSVCTAIDISPESCEYTLAVAREHNADVRVVQGDVLASPFHDNEFTLSFSFGLIEHLSPSEQTDLVKEMIRVSENLVIVGVPNMRPGSAFDLFSRNSVHFDPALEHLNVNIHKLLDDCGTQFLYATGLNVILSTDEIADHNEWRDFQTHVTGYAPKSSYDLSDVESMVKGELALSDTDRMEKGFLAYVVAKV